jgi:effector-binding domain-containing protein
MTSEPTITQRTATPYVAITANVAMNDLGTVVPPLNEEVFAWLTARDIAPAGAPFWKYNLVDMTRGLQIEAGVATPEPVEGDERVHAGVLPAGRYATLTHIGHPKTLIDATARLLAWAEEEGLRWDVSPSAQGERWGCRLEIYHDEPGQDMNLWETELAFRLAD